MKNTILILILIISFDYLSSQSNCYISYSYDNSGNRISRTYVGSCAKTGGEDLEESLMKENDENLSSSEDINNESKRSFKLYPNPISNEIYLESKNINDKLIYKIVRSDGVLILSSKLESEINTLDVSNLIAGHYILLVYDNNNILKYKNYILKQ